MPIKITTLPLLSAETDNNDEVETDTLIPVKDSMPSSFLFTKENTITRAEKLDSFFSKLTGKKNLHGLSIWETPTCVDTYCRW